MKLICQLLFVFDHKNRISISVAEEWNSEVRSFDSVIRMVFWNSWEISKGEHLEEFGREPVCFHWVEWDDVNIVHQGVWMWHLYLFN